MNKFLKKFGKSKKDDTANHDFQNEIEETTQAQNNVDNQISQIDEQTQKQIAGADFNKEDDSEKPKDISEMSATGAVNTGKKGKVQLAVLAVAALLFMLIGIGVAMARWQDKREANRVSEAEEQAQAQKQLADGKVNVEDDKANIANAKFNDLPPPAIAKENELGADGMPVMPPATGAGANSYTTPEPVMPTYTAEPNPVPVYEPPPTPVTPTFTAEPNPVPVYEPPPIPTYTAEPKPTPKKEEKQVEVKADKQDSLFFNPIGVPEVAPKIKGADSHVMVNIKTHKKSTNKQRKDDDNNGVGGKLKPTVLVNSRASRRKQKSLLMKKGTIIPCVLKTKINSTYKGFVICQTSRDVYSADGKTLLVERGSQVFGEDNVELKQGQARIAVLWSKIETPKGVVVNINSPAVGKMGQMGVGAKVNNHYKQRFGAAILLSIIQDSLDAGFSRLNKNQGKTNNNNANETVSNTKKTTESMSEQALEHSIDIPPSATVNAGTLLNIMVVRDIDFNDVYKLGK